MVAFPDWLDKRPKIKRLYKELSPREKAAYEAAWNRGGATAAKKYMNSFGTSSTGGSTTLDDAAITKWLDDHPLIKNQYSELNETDRKTYVDVFIKNGQKSAKKFLNEALNLVSADTATTEIDGVAVPTATKYPTPTLITKPDNLTVADYKYTEGIVGEEAAIVSGIGDPNYTKTGAIGGGNLEKVTPIKSADYKTTEGIDSYTAADTGYSPVDPMSFAATYGEASREEILKNFELANQLALDQLDLELGGLVDYAEGSAALKRKEASIDNIFNQDQRLRQIEQGIPGVKSDLENQSVRANAYAEGRLPNAMEDRMMELNTRSRATDTSQAAGFGANSLAAQKASTLMSAEQRLSVAQMGEQLLSKNIEARAGLYLAPTQYISAGKQINVMPTQSASVLSASALGEINKLASVSATTALGSTVTQAQFSANIVNDISKFNANKQQDTEKFNVSFAEKQIAFKASMDTRRLEFNARMAASENMSEAELQQRTQEFNASMAVQQEQFDTNQQIAIDTFNADMEVNQNQFNASILQRSNEFNANQSVDQNKFVTSLDQRVKEFNTTLEFNTNVSNTGIENAFSLGRFDYGVTYKGLIAGAINKAKDTRLQLDLAYEELAIYEASLLAQQEIELIRLSKIADATTPGTPDEVKGDGDEGTEEGDGDGGDGDEGDEGGDSGVDRDKYPYSDEKGPYGKNGIRPPKKNPK